jgi:hypothetical protein
MPELTLGRPEEQEGPEVVVIRKEKGAAKEAKAEVKETAAEETTEGESKE